MRLGAVLMAVLVPSLAMTAACGGDPPPKPKAPTEVEKPAEPTAEQPKAPDAVKEAENVSDVHIDKSILAACGIPEPEAFFAYNSASVRPTDTNPLDKVATCFISGPLKGKGLRVVGHADPRGSAEYNMVLGHKRADAVSGYLRTKGMAKEKTETTSRGAMDAKGTDESGYSKDRRVDVMLSQ